MYKRNSFFTGAALLAAFLSFEIGSARAQSVRDMGNRISRLENEIDTLNRALYRGERQRITIKNSNSSTDLGDPAVQAGTEIRIQQLELELRNLTGKIEEQAFEMRQLRDQMARMSGDLELRLSDLEKASGGSANVPVSAGRFNSSSSLNNSGLKPAGSAPEISNKGFTYNSRDVRANNAPKVGQLGTLRQNANVATSSNGSFNDPAAAYENAFSLLKSANYAAAEKEFSGFLSKFQDHALAGNAQYWLGETYYVRGQYEQASRTFAEGYQKYPKGSKAADNLLKLGLSLANTGNKSDACIALEQLTKEYNSGVGPVIRRAGQEIKRLGC